MLIRSIPPSRKSLADTTVELPEILSRQTQPPHGMSAELTTKLIDDGTLISWQRCGGDAPRGSHTLPSAGCRPGTATHCHRYTDLPASAPPAAHSTGTRLPPSVR